MPISVIQKPAQSTGVAEQLGLARDLHREMVRSNDFTGVLVAINFAIWLKFKEANLFCLLTFVFLLL
jgi:hypothetical protein